MSLPSVNAPAVDAPTASAKLPGAPEVALDADKPKKKSSLFGGLLGRKKDKKDAGVQVPIVVAFPCAVCFPRPRATHVTLLTAEKMKQSKSH